jgi:hypothetical protein
LPVRGFGLSLLARVLPDGHHTGACGHGAPLYLSYILCQLCYYLRVKLARVKALSAQRIAVWQLS